MTFESVTSQNGEPVTVKQSINLIIFSKKKTKAREAFFSWAASGKMQMASQPLTKNRSEQNGGKKSDHHNLKHQFNGYRSLPVARVYLTDCQQ